MNILFISPNSPFESIGGVERYVINLINYFKIQPDIKTYLILPTVEKSHVITEGNITIYYDNNLSVPRKIKSPELITSKAKGFADLIESIINDHNIDVICAENIIAGPKAAFILRLNMLATLYKIPLILRLHVYAESPLQIELTNSLMWDHISCVSRSVAGDCFQKGTDINKLSTDYLGVNTKDFNPESTDYNLKKELGLTPETKIVLTAGRIVTGSKNMLREKGMINLLEAFSRLSPRYPNLHLVIGVAKASDNLIDDFNSAYEMLLGFIRINDIEEKTTVKMFELDQMPDVYRGSDVLVLAAEKNETFGQIFIEAMACGLPVIGAKTGGMPEIINDGINGYIVQTNDPSVLAQKIENLLTDESVRERFIEEGHNTVKEKFTIEKQFTEFVKMINNTASGNQKIA